jgi:hypothetical protein
MMKGIGGYDNVHGWIIVQSMDYEELKRFIEEQPGGYRHVSWRGIQLGDVTVVDRYGRPKVEGWYGRTTL